MAEQIKVMIVEDDLLLSIVEEKMVSRLGYDVVCTATSGEETLRKIRDFNPHILLIDVNLAGEINGIETVEKLQNSHFGVPTIFLSGDNSTESLNYASSVDYVDFLLKPVKSNDLACSLEKAAGMELHKAQNAA